mmetsp:Transcript_8402/g.35146  ORF Transcript_8402/g.35146 Transcript_8402/m.35146 type:complete len:126 (+) Transcript_8402:35-412(+)
MPKGDATDVLITQSQLEARRNMKGKHKPIFAPDLKQMMYGFGDHPEPRDETVEMLDEIVQEYIAQMCAAASRRRAAIRGGRTNMNDIISLIKDDPKKYGRAIELLIHSKIVKKFKESADTKGDGR